jgi:O-antigen ligase
MAYGGVLAWTEEWLRFAALAAVGVLAWSMRAKAWITGPHVRVALPAMLLVVWALVQAAPLPRGVVRALSPRNAALQAELVPTEGSAGLPALLLDRARTDGLRVEADATPWSVPEDPGRLRGARFSFSIAPASTVRAALSWVTAILFFVLAAVLGRDPLARWWLLWLASVSGGLIGLTTILQRVIGPDVFPWLAGSFPNLTLVGPFVNANHTAAFVVMGALTSLGLVQAILAQPVGTLSLHGIRIALTDRAWAVPRLTALAVLGSLALAGLVLSASRGGWVSFVFGLAALVPARRVREMLPAAVLAAAGLGVAVGLASWVGSEQPSSPTPFGMASRDPSLSMRIDIWRGTLRMIQDHPWTGTGLGTYRSVYASYERPGEWMITEDAHNDYLQLGAESGLIGAAFAVWGLVAFGLFVLRPALSRSGGRPTTVAAAASVLAVLVHSVIDFPLQMPAVAILFSVLAGVVVAAAEESAGTRVENPA